MNDQFRRLSGLSDVRTEAVLGGNVSELLKNLVETLNSVERALNAYVQKLSGTEGWASHGATITYGGRPRASIALIANQVKGMVTMDRCRIDITPYEGDVLELTLEVSRMVRDVTYGQKADREMVKVIDGGDVKIDNLTPRVLLDPTIPFWKKAADLRPKPMRGGEALSIESFDILRILDRGPMAADYQTEWVDLETAGLIKQAIPGAAVGRRVYVITSAGRAALEDAP